MEKFKKVIRPGTVKAGYPERKVDLFCKIEFDGKRLSITGVEGPKKNGDAYGSCGQVEMGYRHSNPEQDDKRYGDRLTEIVAFSSGWDQEKFYRLMDVWHEWHTNDLTPECEHQRALGWRKLATEEVTIYHWELTSEVIRDQQRIKEWALDQLKKGLNVNLVGNESFVLALKYTITTESSDLSPSELIHYYQPRKSTAWSRHEEKKTLGWLTQKDHSRGILSKPCPECGYKYGSSWLTREVPVDVIDFLRSLP